MYQCLQSDPVDGKNYTLWGSGPDHDSTICKKVLAAKANDDLIKNCCDAEWKANKQCDWDSASCTDAPVTSRPINPLEAGEGLATCMMVPDKKPDQCTDCVTSKEISDAGYTPGQHSRFDPNYLTILIDAWQAETDYWTEIGSAQNCIGLCEKSGLTQKYGMTGATRKFVTPLSWEVTKAKAAAAALLPQL